MKVGVKFCGNCNPRFNAPEMARSLAKIATDFEFVRWDSPEGYQALLVINSCQVGCATRPAFSGSCIVVTNETVDHWPVSEHELPNAVVNALRHCLVSG